MCVLICSLASFRMMKTTTKKLLIIFMIFERDRKILHYVVLLKYTIKHYPNTQYKSPIFVLLTSNIDTMCQH